MISLPRRYRTDSNSCQLSMSASLACSHWLHLVYPLLLYARTLADNGRFQNFLFDYDFGIECLNASKQKQRDVI